MCSNPLSMCRMSSAFRSSRRLLEYKTATMAPMIPKTGKVIPMIKVSIWVSVS